MSTITHSTRPWRFDPASGFVYDAEGAVVCQLFNKWEENFDKAEENGPVIAGAPDMRQTLLDVLSDCFILRDLAGIPRGHIEFITDHLIGPLQAALGKSTVNA